jgi:hypothetical protein
MNKNVTKGKGSSARANESGNVPNPYVSMPATFI